MKDFHRIDISQCPKDSSCQIYCPDGTLLVETDQELMFNYIRCEIAKTGQEGYYIIFNGERRDINRFGVVEDYPDGLFESGYKLASETLMCAVERRKSEKKAQYWKKRNFWKKFRNKSNEENNGYKQNEADLG